MNKLKISSEKELENAIIEAKIPRTICRYFPPVRKKTEPVQNLFDPGRNLFCPPNILLFSGVL